MSRRMVILSVVLTIAAVGQIVLSFLLYNRDGNSAVRNVGWVILWVSAIFGWLPIFTLRKWGAVPKGQQYVTTTALVDRGIYAVVRHPQYLSGMLLGVALSLITQHWAVALLGIPVVIIFYISTYDEEKCSIARFGEQYTRYMERVPRLNALLGIVRLMRRKAE